MKTKTLYSNEKKLYICGSYKLGDKVETIDKKIYTIQTIMSFPYQPNLEAYYIRYPQSKAETEYGMIKNIKYKLEEKKNEKTQ